MISISNLNSIQKSAKYSYPSSTSPLDSQINSTKKSYVGVDVSKFFFAVCIVALHSEALNCLPDIANYMITRILFRVAVPYFFISSGFFLGKKLLNTPKEQYLNLILTYCKRLLKPLIFFEIISLLYYGFVFLYSGQGVLPTIIKLVQSIIFYPYGALWFVQACIVGALLLYPFLKRDKLNIALVIGTILYSFALITNNYSFLITNTPLEKIVMIYMQYCVSARNGLFTGFIFLALGILCSKIYEKSPKSKTTTPIITLAFFVVYIAEILLVYYFNKKPLDDGALYISHLFFIPVLFITTLQINSIQISPKVAVLLRNLSTGVYFLHRPILYVLSYLKLEESLNFLITLCLAIFLCLFAYKSRCKFLSSLLK